MARDGVRFKIGEVEYQNHCELDDRIIIGDDRHAALVIGMHIGEQCAMQFGALMAGYANPNEAMECGIRIRVREWKPGLLTTWYADIHPAMHMEWIEWKQKRDCPMGRYTAPPVAQ